MEFRGKSLVPEEMSPTVGAPVSGSSVQSLSGHRCSLDSRGYLRKRQLSGGRSVIQERRKSAVICSSKLICRDMCRRLQNACADLVCSFQSRVDGIDDANEYPMVRLHGPSNQFQSAAAIWLTGHLNVEIRYLQRKKFGQEPCVIDIRAVRCIAIAAGA
jgi:hypothetical protein